MFNFFTSSSFSLLIWEAYSNLIPLGHFINHDKVIISCKFGTFKLHLRYGEV